ncbi:unnamed protein product [Trichobilharzia regenti]|nr:unnamed protein product [Trichobilharzia regenti]
MEKDLSYGEVVGNTNKSDDVNPRNTAVQVKKGEEEVHKNAWLPSESTRNALLNRNTPTKPAEIKPVLMGKDYEIVNSNNSGGGGSLSTFADPFHYLLVQFMGDEPGVNAIRRAPSIEQVNQNVDGLKELIVSYLLFWWN